MGGEGFWGSWWGADGWIFWFWRRRGARRKTADDCVHRVRGVKMSADKNGKLNVNVRINVSSNVSTSRFLCINLQECT